MSRTAFFTICARNFLAYAKNLRSHLAQHHPDCGFFVFLSDDSAGIDTATFSFPIVPLERLSIDKIEDMKIYYNITEFCTSLKPFAFSHLFSAGYDTVVYLDPDIQVISPFVELFSLLDGGSTCVLTPHLTAPEPSGQIDDLRLLQLGTFNLGFCAVKKSEETIELMRWWGRRLRTHSLIDLAQGLFVDQKWADLFPSFVSDFKALRHPGYNLAYWNLHQRQLTNEGSQYYADGLPLRFLHFSGFDLRDRSRLTRHIGGTERGRIGLMATLMDEYADDVVREGHEAYASIPYAFSWNGARGQNLHTPEKAKPAAEPSLRRVHRLMAAANGARLAVGNHGLNPELMLRGLRYIRRHGLVPLLREMAALSDRKRQLIEPQRKKQRQPGDAAKAKVARLLFVDWGLPNPHSDAGGLFSYQIVRVLRSMGISVTVLPLEWRAQEHKRLYDEIGALVVDVSLWSNARDYISATSGQFDAIILNRAPAVFPLMSSFAEYHQRAALILNAHDLHYLREERAAAVSGDALLARRASTTKQEELDVISSVDTVWLVSNVESYFLADENDDTSVLIQPLVVDSVASLDIDTSNDRDTLLFVGSFDHLPNVDAVHSFVTDIWPQLSRAHPQLSLEIIGKNMPASLAQISQGSRIRVLGSVGDLEPHFRTAIASIAPLRFGAGIKGKLLTSWSYGVPVIGTPIAAEGLPGNSAGALIEATSFAEYSRTINELTASENWIAASEASRTYLRENFSSTQLRQTLDDLFNGYEAGNCPIPNRHKIESYEDYLNHERRSDQAWIKRRTHERELVDRSDELIHTSGYCAVCGRNSTFVTSYQWSSSKYSDGRDEPNWREHVACGHCGLVTRLRATIHHLQTTSLHRSDEVYLTERVTPFYSYMAQRVDRIIGSEYLGPNLAPGEVVNGIRHEDLQRLSFPNESFDLIVSLDVLEHVPDFQRAFAELHRCLRPGGRAVVAVPFAQRSAKNVIRAELLADGSLVHHLPPEFHGNPVDHEGGSLCYRYYGWEMLDFARSIGFSKAAGYSYWSRKYQYLGTENWIFEFVR